MKRLVQSLFVIGLLASAMALAQDDFDYDSFWEMQDGGIEKEVDEFTGTAACYHRVSQEKDPRVAIDFINKEGSLFFTMARYFSSPDYVFSTLGIHGDSEVYLRFSEGDVLNLVPRYAEGSWERNYGMDYAEFDDPELILRLLDLADDLRVRFEGPHGRDDFTVPAEFFQTANAGFGQECRPGMFP